jgi:hypothetical protein
MSKPKSCLPHRRWRSFFHVTHLKNLPGIIRYGLIPDLSPRLTKRSWVCDVDLLPWAIQHVAQTHRWPMSDLRIIRVCVPADILVRHRTGVYWCNFVIPPKNVGAVLSR